jgi:hypothetical protein
MLHEGRARRLLLYEEAMNVKRICFLGTRTGNFDATASLFRDVLVLEGVRAEAGWSIFQLPSGRGPARRLRRRSGMSHEHGDT